MTDGQRKSLHAAYDWIAKANEHLNRASAELKKIVARRIPVNRLL
jgi:hypothetical protein